MSDLTLPDSIQAAIDATANVKLHSAHTDQDILEQVYRLRRLADDAEGEDVEGDVEDQVEGVVATLLDLLDERRVHRRASLRRNAMPLQQP